MQKYMVYKIVILVKQEIYSQYCSFLKVNSFEIYLKEKKSFFRNMLIFSFMRFFGKFLYFNTILH